MKPEMIADLQAPTPKEDISFKPQGKSMASKHGPGYVCRAVPYVDARFVMQRLDDAVGVGNWATDVKNVGGLVAVGIGIYNETLEAWVWKWDTGMEGNPFQPAGPDNGQQKKSDKRDEVAYKGMVSNGLKRAAIQWGIARDIYALNVHWMPCEVWPDNIEKWKAWLPENKPPHAGGSGGGTVVPLKPGTAKAKTTDDVAPRLDATNKILKVLMERGGMTLAGGMRWIEAKIKATDGSMDAYRDVYAEAIKEVGA